MPNELVLTPEHQQRIVEIYASTPDLSILTKKVFGNNNLDGRSQEGRAIRRFLVEKGLKYKTTKKDPPVELELSEHQQAFINQNSRSMSAFEMAKMLFPEREIKTVLAKECRTILEYMRKELPKNIQNAESAIGLSYAPPKNIPSAVAVINKASLQELDCTKLSAAHRQAVAAYLKFVNSPRLIQIVTGYSDITDRDLFESEFTRFTWDKPDLTADDIALYISVCQDIVTNKRLVLHMNKLNAMFEETEQNQDLSIKLADTIKAKSDEYDKVQKRIESLLKKLSGDRAERMKKQASKSANFLSLVEAFQQEEERKRLLIIARSQRERIKAEADRLESLDEFKARIMGISKQEVL